MDLNAIRRALAAQLRAEITGLPLTVYHFVPQDASAPFAYVQTERVEYNRTSRNKSIEVDLSIMLMVSTSDDETAQEQIDAFLSDSDATTSIKLACDAANGAPGQGALGGLCDYVHLSGTDGAPRWFEWGEGKKYHGVGLKVRILGTGA